MKLANRSVSTTHLASSSGLACSQRMRFETGSEAPDSTGQKTQCRKLTVGARSKLTTVLCETPLLRAPGWFHQSLQSACRPRYEKKGMHREPLRHADTASERARAIAAIFQQSPPQLKCKAEKRRDDRELACPALPCPPPLRCCGPGRRMKQTPCFASRVHLIRVHLGCI